MDLTQSHSVVGLRQVEAALRRAAFEAGRQAQDVQLIAVSKGHSANEIDPVLAAGHRVFGENRVQEAAGKWPGLRLGWPDVELHLIGPLQSNKARAAVQLFDAIQSLDRLSLARELAREIERQAQHPRLFVQVNTGLEPQKAGLPPSQIDSFLTACRTEFSLTIEGLMCIPPADELAAPHFALLKSLAHRHGLSGLSMGMSADFEMAIQLGATHVRVGSAIFGARAADRAAPIGGSA